MFNKKNSLIIFICLGAMIFSSIGCEPLRKKFVRKKKEEKESGIVPVLEPIDYAPKKIYSLLEQYQRHYSLWKVWDRELIQAIQEGKTVKAQEYNLAQLIEQIEEMKKWMIEEKQKELTPLIDELHAIQRDLSQPSVTHSDFTMTKTLERNSKTIRHDFNPKSMEHFLTESKEDEKIH